MLRLDNFVDAAASLPCKLRDELTDIRELDLVVQNAMDKQEKKTCAFFQNAALMNSRKRESIFESLLADYENVLEVADEKVNIAERLHNMASEYLEQLDQQIDMFEIELESEYPGVTKVVQERVLKKARKNENCENNANLQDIIERKRSTSTSTLVTCGMSEVDEQMQQEVVYHLANSNGDGGAITAGDKLSTTADLSLYCICNRQAYGDMVACDNELCPHEWFHYSCMHMKMAPEGKWYCPKCIVCKVYLERC